MARLNEPPQPSGESIDGLKRRFVRQNREIAKFAIQNIEIAKANSTQSIKIRNLESENVTLREQIIKLRYEAKKSTEFAVVEGVNLVRGKLEAKISELGGLMQELGNVHKNLDIQRKQKRRSISRNSPKRPPDQTRRLSPILEDKSVPRQTMDAEELLGIFADPANTTDSPDLGPPPVAHFDEGDPIKFDHTQKLSPREGSAESAEEAQPTLSANLGTRKKRRESFHRIDMSVKNEIVDSHRYTASIPTAMPASQPIKPSAKRKLDVRDDDDQRTVDEPGKPNPQVDRRGSELRMNDNGLTTSITSEMIKAAGEKAPEAAMSSIIGNDGKEKVSGASATITATGRKALGPKSVNIDPVNSPAKVSRSSKDKIIEAKDDLAKIARERNRAQDKPRAKNPVVARPKVVASKDIEVRKPLEAPSKTSAPHLPQIFSPELYEPLAARPESRDTPPPPDLGSNTGTGSFGRASRRPKGNVNYAQPNLRDKMRRPTKELVDAVGAEERARIAKAESDVSKPVFIKQEDDADPEPTWKMNAPQNDERMRPEPTRPLDKKIGAAELPASVITERRRRTFVPALNDDAMDPLKPASGAASAIAALTAATQRSKRRGAEAGRGVEKEEQSREPMERTSIYEFTGSSPVDSSGNPVDDTGQEAHAKTMRPSRRHSSVPASTEPGTGSIMISRRGDRRRRETVVARQSGDSGEKAGGPVSGTRNVLNVGAGSDEAAVLAGRGERAASRRRSMMI